jgi:hypothetical protein
MHVRLSPTPAGVSLCMSTHPGHMPMKGVDCMIAKILSDALQAFQFAAIASKTDRITADQIRRLLARHDSEA